MNGVIIHTLRTRSNKNLVTFRNQGQGHNEGQALKMKNIERQIYATLLLVTFGFLILTTPSKILPLYVQAFGFGDTPTKFAVYYMIYHLAHKLLYTNNGINFLFYVMSGHKFRNDLIKLFGCCKEHGKPRTISSDTNVSCISHTEMNAKEASIQTPALD